MQNCTRVYIRPFLCTESTSLTNQMNLKASKLNDEKCPGNTKSYKIGNSSDSQFEVSLANMIGEFLKLRLIQNDLSNCQSSVALRSTAMARLSRHSSMIVLHQTYRPILWHQLLLPHCCAPVSRSDPHASVRVLPLVVHSPAAAVGYDSHQVPPGQKRPERSAEIGGGGYISRS